MKFFSYPILRTFTIMLLASVLSGLIRGDGGVLLTEILSNTILLFGGFLSGAIATRDIYVSINDKEVAKNDERKK